MAAALRGGSLRGAHLEELSEHLFLPLGVVLLCLGPLLQEDDPLLVRHPGPLPPTVLLGALLRHPETLGRF